MSQPYVNNLKERASDRRKENRELIRYLKKKKPADLDQIVQDLHNKVFEEVDCLKCAGCCKSISPFLIDRDIQRISKHLRIKPSVFVADYLLKDEEDDYVFRTSPCPFLGSDNYCHIYDHRPRACREYPHTDRNRFHQILDLSLKNTFICPAVFLIFEELKIIYKK